MDCGVAASLCHRSPYCHARSSDPIFFRAAGSQRDRDYLAEASFVRPGRPAQTSLPHGRGSEAIRAEARAWQFDRFRVGRVM